LVKKKKREGERGRDGKKKALHICESSLQLSYEGIERGGGISDVAKKANPN